MDSYCEDTPVKRARRLKKEKKNEKRHFPVSVVDFMENRFLFTKRSGQLVITLIAFHVYLNMLSSKHTFKNFEFILGIYFFSSLGHFKK